MVRHRTRGVRGDRGAAMVEFALILPLLLTLLLGIIEFGFLFFQQISVTQGARAGAREYALHHDDPGFALTGVVGAAAPGVTGLTATAVLSPPLPGLPVAADGSCAPTWTVTVTAVKTYTTLTGWFDGILSPNITLQGKGAMRCGG